MLETVLLPDVDCSHDLQEPEKEKYETKLIAAITSRFREIK